MRAFSPPADLDDLVERVFAAAEDSSLVSIMLRELSAAVGADAAYLSLHATGGVQRVHTWPENARSTGQLTCRERVGATEVTLTFHREATREPFCDLAAEIGNALAWHVAQAFDTQDTVRALNAQADDLVQILNHVPAPLLVIDAEARIMRANAAAHACLDRADGLQRRDGSLVADQPKGQRALTEAVRRATEADALGPQLLLVARQHVAPLGVVLLPYGVSATGRRILILLHDPAQPMPLDATWLQKLCGLTPTERMLVEALADGLTVQDFAAARECSEHTARSHLKKVLEKTGAGRQPELVRMVATAPSRRR